MYVLQSVWNLIVQNDNVLVIFCGEFCIGPTYLFLFNGVKADGRGRGVSRTNRGVGVRGGGLMWGRSHAWPLAGVETMLMPWLSPLACLDNDKSICIAHCVQ